MSGQEAERASISNVSNADPCVVTTSAVHGYTTGDFVRLTDMNSSIPVLRGMDQINGGKFKVVVINTTSFSLKDPITDADINSTNYTPYVTGGNTNIVQTSFIFTGDT